MLIENSKDNLVANSFNVHIYYSLSEWNINKFYKGVQCTWDMTTFLDNIKLSLT